MEIKKRGCLEKNIILVFEKKSIIIWVLEYLYVEEIIENIREGC